MNKKYYEKPEMEVTYLLTDDILSSSSEGLDTDINVEDLFG